MYFNKITLLNTLQSVFFSLNGVNERLTIYPFNKYAIGEKKITHDYYCIRIWKTKAIYDYHLEEINMNNLIGCIDYKINSDNIKIEYLSVKDDFSAITGYENIIMDKEEALELKKHLILHIVNIAIKNNIRFIYLDVHRNLKFYNYYYKNEGFEITDNLCPDNPYWIQTVKILNFTTKV